MPCFPLFLPSGINAQYLAMEGARVDDESERNQEADRSAGECAQGGALGLAGDREAEAPADGGSETDADAEMSFASVSAELDQDSEAGSRPTRSEARTAEAAMGVVARAAAERVGEEDLDEVYFPEIRVDYTVTDRLAGLAEEIFGDLLTVRIQTLWWWSLGLTKMLVNLRGLEQTMYDVIDNPDLIHRLMAILRDGTLAMLDDLEEDGLLSLNNDGTYVGSGGLGWSDELPQPDFDGKVRTSDMWGFCESQETVGLSPQMFAEFVFPYQLPIMKRFGLNCYGCCEPLDKRWHVVKQFPRLRRVSVSAWADWAKMAEMLGGRFVFSMKPSPTDLAMDTFDEARIRAELREALQTTQDCHIEIIMKDNHTINNDPRRVVRWVQIAREEAQNL